MARPIGRDIRIDEDHLRRIEALAAAHSTSSNQHFVEFATEVIDGPEWPRTGYEVRLLCSSLVTAHAIDRGMATVGRDDEAEHIRRNTSLVVPTTTQEVVGDRLEDTPHPSHLAKGEL